MSNQEILDKWLAAAAEEFADLTGRRNATITDPKENQQFAKQLLEFLKNHPNKPKFLISIVSIKVGPQVPRKPGYGTVTIETVCR